MQKSFEKPKGMKYTEMAMYIDAHEPELLDKNVDSNVENNVYKYIYLICYALAYKARYFGRNEHIYDDFALYMASNVYTVLLKRRAAFNEGKTYRNREIKPVKSVLNYIKATLYPFKVDYQQENYREIINPLMANDTSHYKEIMTNSIQEDYRGELEDSFSAALDDLPNIIENVMQQTPFKKHSTMKSRIVMSIYLTLIDQTTLPQHLKNKIARKRTYNTNWEMSVRFMRAHEAVGRPARLWHLDPSYENYINVLAAKVKSGLSKCAQYYVHDDELTAELIDRVMDSAYATYDAAPEE